MERYLVIDGYYNGLPNQQLLWTGSYNDTVGALRHNDESLMKIWGHPDIFSAFHTNVQTAASTPTPPPKRDPVELATGARQGTRPGRDSAAWPGGFTAGGVARGPGRSGRRARRVARGRVRRAWSWRGWRGS